MSAREVDAQQCSVLYAAPFVAVVGFVLLVVAPADAKKAKEKTLTGCVRSTPNGYELVTLSKKGKAKHYGLAGAQNFAGLVGHEVRVQGRSMKTTMNVSSVKDVAASCR
jgi:hypothetical protein